MPLHSQRLATAYVVDVAAVAGPIATTCLASARLSLVHAETTIYIAIGVCTVGAANCARTAGSVVTGIGATRDGGRSS